MSTHDDGYDDVPAQNLFDPNAALPGYGEQTTAALPTAQPGQPAERESGGWHVGLDIGLLVLRVVLGATMLAHGAQKLFGAFDGPGIDGFAKALGGMGYTSQTTLLSWITAVSEVGGGALLILGLFTPIGAAAILGVAANIVYVKFQSGFFIGERPGFEYELLLGAVAFALLFTGSGRVALDANTPWRRRPVPFGLVGLVLASAATVAVALLCR